MNLTGVTFRAVANSKNGSLNTETEMRFTSDDGPGKRIGESELELLYRRKHKR